MDMQQEKQEGMSKETIPGFRFYPTEDELVSFYLHNKLEEKRVEELNRVIPVINIYESEPWQLPKLSGELCSGDAEQWFFFVPRQEREARGGRPSRTTASGYWKATGSPSHVYSSDNRVIGVKKSLVFYKGKAPMGRKTKWKMNEYRAIKEEWSTSSTHVIPKLRYEVSLCRVYIVSGSFRAFDRRPVGAGTSREAVVPTIEDDDKDVRSQTQRGATMDRKNSVEISASPEEVSVDRVDGEGKHLEMDGELRRMWEWDQFNDHMQLP
ncbi:NAC domain-containing protein 90-like [Coffea eugenioides]|uniref:NAC domain-containing protein 90 n=1 Tax=Coffea arabica TaxID=13443 RepID=A0A6P6U035_COFAR|nr:NAC domain-containing protein 90-like [Coffea arabica]XP_027184824.1 NAC domain-containing protein 90-like [Coffea eugenioides]